MATKRPEKIRRPPLEESSDPSTNPERLGELARHKEMAVRRAAWRNPSLPEGAWRKALLEGVLEPWDNPMASIYLLAWTPQEKDRGLTLVSAARWSAQELWMNPERCSPDGKALIAAKTQAWWATSEKADDMTNFLGGWAQVKGEGSPEHHEVVLLLVRCVRTVPVLMAKDRQALDLLEAWAAGGDELRNEAYALAESMAVKSACRFAQDPSYSSSFTILEVLQSVGSPVEHERLLADLIRQEMPLPPVVE